MRPLLSTLVLMLVFSACASGEDSVQEDGQPTTTTTTASGDDSTGSTAAPTTTIDLSALPSIADDIDVPVIEQLTAISGGGSRPMLEWSALDGADRYFVFVNAAAGEIYWAWRTRDTSVPVGGFPQLDEGAAGPAVSEGMTWVVMALDAESNVVGISPRRPISP